MQRREGWGREEWCTSHAHTHGSARAALEPGSGGGRGAPSETSSSETVQPSPPLHRRLPYLSRAVSSSRSVSSTVRCAGRPSWGGRSAGSRPLRGSGSTRHVAACDQACAATRSSNANGGEAAAGGGEAGGCVCCPPDGEVLHAPASLPPPPPPPPAALPPPPADPTERSSTRPMYEPAPTAVARSS